MPDFNSSSIPAAGQNFNLGIGQQGVGIQNMTGQPQGMNLSNMLNQPSNFSLNYNGQTPDLSNAVPFVDAFQGPSEREETLFNSPSIANMYSSGVQSMYNDPQNILPTNNYTGCFRGLYYTNGNYTQPC